MIRLLAMVRLPFPYIYHQKLFKLCPPVWHIFDPTEKKTETYKAMNFDCDSGELFHRLALNVDKRK